LVWFHIISSIFSFGAKQSRRKKWRRGEGEKEITLALS
jgi:hypothetical protein